jgi:hypothetical protein
MYLGVHAYARFEPFEFRHRLYTLDVSATASINGFCMGFMNFFNPASGHPEPKHPQPFPELARSVKIASLSFLSFFPYHTTEKNWSFVFVAAGRKHIIMLLPLRIPFPPFSHLLFIGFCQTKKEKKEARIMSSFFYCGHQSIS